LAPRLLPGRCRTPGKRGVMTPQGRASPALNLGSPLPAGQDGNYSINPPSYTKLDESGNALPDTATSWVMVRDNVTGIIWEVKTNDNGSYDFSNPHDADNRYTWYDPNPETNGGDPGVIPIGISSYTKQFLDAINGANFGGYSDWRLPTLKELRSIAIYGWRSPSININYFPNTKSSYFWSSTTYVGSPGNAWLISFKDGNDFLNGKSFNTYVRAVRGGQ